MLGSTLEKRVKDLEKGKVDKTGGVIQGKIVLFDNMFCQQDPSVDKTDITEIHSFPTRVVYDNQGRVTGRELLYENIQSLNDQTSPSGTEDCTLVRIRTYTAVPGGTTFTEVRNSVWSDGYSSMATNNIWPISNNKYALGTATAKWTEVFATTGSINTSDERHKTNIINIPDTVLDAWADVKFVQYQFNAAVEDKGVAQARIHTGLIAQRIKTAFNDHGLDAFKYGLLCHNEWPDRYDVDENGEPVLETQAGDLYSLRYEECLCVEAAYQRRELESLKARLEALEAQLG